MINLLIAEDHQSLIDGIDLLFRQDEDIKIVATANDGESLIELLKTHEADVVLTDINMPKMNGVEVCKHIKSNNNKIKVIAYTMFESPQAVRDMITAGADGYILKKRPLNKLLARCVASSFSCSAIFLFLLWDLEMKNAIKIARMTINNRPTIKPIIRSLSTSFSASSKSLAAV